MQKIFRIHKKKWTSKKKIGNQKISGRPQARGKLTLKLSI